MDESKSDDHAASAGGVGHTAHDESLSEDSASSLNEETIRGLREAGATYVRQIYPDAPEDLQERYVDQVIEGIQWLNRQWGPHRRCPYCDHSGWAVGVPVEILTEPLLPDNVASKLVPVFPVTCTTCGQTTLISGPYAGVRKPGAGS
jgi:hypothetical protein